jgi:hypothetical protein
LTDVYKVDEVRMQMQGFKTDTFLEYSYANKVALLPNETKEEEN